MYKTDKTIFIKVSAEDYFRLIELRGKLKANNWRHLLQKMIDIVDIKLSEK